LPPGKGLRADSKKSGGSVSISALDERRALESQRLPPSKDSCMVELIGNFAAFVIVLLLGAAAFTASLAVAAAELLRYRERAWFDGG
jgi:hypothetical protein